MHQTTRGAASIEICPTRGRRFPQALGTDGGSARRDDETERQRKAKKVFERGIIQRGEAAVADEHGRLPPGVIHEIIGYDAAGRPILKRRRFSIV
jgi:hypothetical protein